MLAVIWLATPSTASAQAGVLFGMNSANINLDAGTSGEIAADTNRRTGFVGGVYFNAPMREMVSVELDALFSQKGTKFQDGPETVSVKLNYVDIPVMARINLPGSGAARVHLLAGPSFNVKVSEKFNQVENDNNEDQFKTFSTSLVMGLGVMVSSFRIDARYGLGLTNILKDSSDGFTAKNKVFSILFGFGG